MEDCLNTLARRYATTRFVKLHHNEAEMDVAVVPAVLAYKGGELFANIMRIVDEIPSGRSLSTDSLELVLRRFVPPPLSLFTFGFGVDWVTTERMFCIRIRVS